MAAERVAKFLGQPFYPFREGNNRIQIALVENGRPFPIDFGVDAINHPSLPKAAFLVCEGAELLHPLALTTKRVDGSDIYLDPMSRLDLSIKTPGMPTVTGKIRQALYEERQLSWWYYDGSLWMPRLETRRFITPRFLPVLATPGFLGPDPYCRVGESYGGKLVVENTPEALSEIVVKFSLTDLATLPKLLAARKELREKWRDFNWGNIYGDMSEKGLMNMCQLLRDSGHLDDRAIALTLQHIGHGGPYTAEELVAEAEAVRISVASWAIRRRTQQYKIWRSQEDSFRM